MKKFILITIMALFSIPIFSQKNEQTDLDRKVEAFFQEHGGW